MKKNIFLLALTALIFMFTAPSTLANNDIKVYYNGYEIYFDQPPVIQDGRTLVPMRKIFETIGARVNWVGETQRIYADYSGVSLVFRDKKGQKGTKRDGPFLSLFCHYL